MNLLMKAVFTVLSVVIWTMAQAVVMIYGWGLTPVSWWYIIGLGLVSLLFSKLMLVLDKPICPKCGHDREAHRVYARDALQAARDEADGDDEL